MKSRIDTSDPRYIVLYAGTHDENNYVEDFEAWRSAWQQRMDAGERFGVIYVYPTVKPIQNASEDKQEEESEEAKRKKRARRERNEERENAFTAARARFRREERTRTNRLITGYAGVYPNEMQPEQLARSQKGYHKFSRYSYGLRGNFFKDVESAKAWLDEIVDHEPLPLSGTGAAGDAETTTAIFYGSSSGSTELIAERVQAAWTEAHGETPPIVNVGDISELSNLLEHERLLIGIPTWNIGKMQDDWEIVYPQLDSVDLSDKQIAIFGVGDQYGYPDNFQDAIGILGRKFRERGAALVGYTSTDGYEYDHSVSIEDGRFMGLAIDDINQPELTDERIARWVEQVEQEWSGLQLEM
ncbi:MAG: flavodoxin [Chloroflexota bacterium]